MEILKDNTDLLLKQSDFGLDDTLDCGQAFRWTKTGNNEYTGAFLNNRLTISECSEKGVIRLHNTTEDDFKNIWYDYFDLQTDYSELKQKFSEDETLSKACSYASGIRILRQDSWEALSSFIISQNNNIPRIKGIISRLCDHYDKYPSADDMKSETAESIGFLRSGFRAGYLIDCISKVLNGEVDFDKIRSMPIDEAQKELMKIKGVGAKVADCTLLFGFYRTEAFPKDVWVKRVMSRWYPNGLPDCTKGVEGIAQQYLFHYIRNVCPDE